MSDREENSWRIGDPQVEWGGRAEGGNEQQFEFSDLKKKLEKQQEKSEDSSAD